MLDLICHIPWPTKS